MSAEPRVPPLTAPHPPATEALLARFMPAGSPIEPLALFRTFAHNTALAESMLPWGRYLLGRDLSVDRRSREIVILRACARAGCEYEWGVHVAFWADRVGLTEAEVAATLDPAPDPQAWAAADHLLLRLVDALHDAADVDDALWAELAAAYGPPQLLDLTLLAGWYRAICGAARAFRVAPEPWARRFPGPPARAAG